MESKSSSPVTIMTGVRSPSGKLRSRRHASNPSITGIITSIRIISGLVCSYVDKACAPFSASSTRRPLCSSASLARILRTGSSSTSKARSGIDSFGRSLTFASSPDLIRPSRCPAPICILPRISARLWTPLPTHWYAPWFPCLCTGRRVGALLPWRYWT